MIYTCQFGELKELPTGNAVNGIFETPLQTPEKQSRDLYVDGVTSESVTFNEYKQLVFRLAALFRDEYGVQQSDVVCLFGPNSIYTAAIHFATVTLAAIMSPANVMYNATELAHQLRMTKPRILIAFDEGLQTANGAVKESGSANTRVVPFSELIKKIRALVKAPSAPFVLPVDVDAAEYPAYYCFSSGTSGLPKGVITTHRNILSNIHQQLMFTKVPFVDNNYAMSAVLPMSHIFGLNIFLWSSTYAGRKTVVFPKFDFQQYLEGCTKHDVKILVIVPPIVLLLGKHPLLDKFPKFKEQIRFIISGAAPLSASTEELARKRLPNCAIMQGYGLTETSPVTHASFISGTDFNPSTVGWLVPGTEARLIDPETGKDAERGELWLRGPQVMKGYLYNEKATKEAINDDGWFMTGDVAIVHKTGEFQIVDRIKELIKSKGHQVAPAELEALLLTQPEVLDSAVIGVPDEHGTTELPRAYVVLAPGADALSVVKKFNGQVAKHKRLWGGAVVVSEIPKSPSGKIQRRQLKAHSKDDVAIGIDFAKL